MSLNVECAMRGDLHIEPGARSSCVRFMESMCSRYVAALRGAPILGGRAHQFVSRNGVNAQARGAPPPKKTAGSPL